MELDASLVIDSVSLREINVGKRYLRIHIIVGQKPQRLSHHSVITDLLYVLVLEDEDGRWLVWYAAVGNIRLGSLIPKMLHIVDKPINSSRQVGELISIDAWRLDFGHNGLRSVVLSRALVGKADWISKETERGSERREEAIIEAKAIIKEEPVAKQEPVAAPKEAAVPCEYPEALMATESDFATEK